MKKLILDDVSVECLVESAGKSFHPEFLFPDFAPSIISEHEYWLLPRFIDHNSGRLLMSIHTYIIRTPDYICLVDTCVGNCKQRPSTPAWNDRQGPWLQNLKSLGISPEDVDYVVCTHLHVDHVGWNTVFRDGIWVPTFPNARYLFHRIEYEFWQENISLDPAARSGANDECFADSVTPVVQAGQAVLVESDHVIDRRLCFEASPGHTPGHICLNLQSGGKDVAFTGDLMHHPIQVACPDWNSRFCVDPELARDSRYAYLHDCAEKEKLVLAAHFASPTLGKVVPEKKGFRFAAVDE